MHCFRAEFVSTPGSWFVDDRLLHITVQLFRPALLYRGLRRSALLLIPSPMALEVPLDSDASSSDVLADELEVLSEVLDDGRVLLRWLPRFWLSSRTRLVKNF